MENLDSDHNTHHKRLFAIVSRTVEEAREQVGSVAGVPHRMALGLPEEATVGAGEVRRDVGPFVTRGSASLSLRVPVRRGRVLPGWAALW